MVHSRASSHRCGHIYATIKRFAAAAAAAAGDNWRDNCSGFGSASHGDGDDGLTLVSFRINSFMRHAAALGLSAGVLMRYHPKMFYVLYTYVVCSACCLPVRTRHPAKVKPQTGCALGLASRRRLWVYEAPNSVGGLYATCQHANDDDDDDDYDVVHADRRTCRVLIDALKYAYNVRSVESVTAFWQLGALPAALPVWRRKR